ncbi:OLC1v1008719C2 [Oldenlandia corymbosa var. corymbosa]|nr:OLC1v1008719C2 [Oldenlandia corymbosa var. corymbosa]
MKIAEELVKKMRPEDLEMTNEYGSTALSLAAISGATKLAKMLVERNHKLVSIASEQEDGQLPVIVAAQYGQKRMVRYLYRVTPKEELSPEKGENGVTLLNCLITAEIYDVAATLLKRFPKLGTIPDHNGDYTLRILSHKPSAFPSGTNFIFWKKWIYSCVVVDSFWSRSKGSHGGESAKTQHSSDPEDHNIDILDSSDDEMAITTHAGARFTSYVRKTLKELGWGLLRCLVPDIKDIHDRKLIHAEARGLLTCIFQEVRELNKSQLETMGIDKILYDAIEHGIIEFVLEILKFTPEIIWRKDKRGRTIFAHAIILRQEKIYSLIHSLGAKKKIIARRHDVFGNNFLHLAAKMSPPSQLERVSGAALQMQRELQWFQEVEAIVQPKCREEKNENMKTPSTLFSDEHKVLAKEGERWMKNTAGSSMIVGTLIAAVMFTTAFTVPGGNDTNTGLPVMLKKQRKAFLLFMGSNALAMFTSSTSILMFLGILTARYAEIDFLKSLPTKLIFGIACLFISIVTMMISFGAAIYLMLINDLSWVSYPIIVFSVIPVALFSLLQFPLLVEMINRTYGSGIFRKPKRKLFSS